MRFFSRSNSNDEDRRSEAPPVAALLDAWRETIATQRHFNEIEWKIRGLWLSALTFVLGGTFLSLKDHGSLGSAFPLHLIPLVGVALALVFWYADVSWYHRLLVGAVLEGIRLEKELQIAGVNVSLTQSIGDESPQSVFGYKIHSKDKIAIFYSSCCFLLIVISLWLGIWLA